MPDKQVDIDLAALAAKDVRRLLAIMSDHETALHDILSDDEVCDWQAIELRWDTDLAPDRHRP
jgi:hypothetical protein